MKLPPTFKALRHRNYRIWFFGYSISLIGSWMQIMAQQVLVYRLTGSATALGMVNFVSLLPLIPFSLLGGSLSDRYSKRLILLITQVVMMAIAITLGIITYTGAVEVWHIYLLAVFSGATQAVDMPTRQAFIVELIEGKEDITNAVALNSAIFNGARAIGPALAGFLVAAVGEASAFFINSFTFLSIIVSLTIMKGLPQHAQKRDKSISYGKHILEGLSHIRKSQALSVILSLVAISAFLSMPYNTLMPVFANKVLLTSSQNIVQSICSNEIINIHCRAPEALPLGFLLAAVGVGAVIGALIVASLPANAKHGRLLTIGNIGFPLVLLLFSLSRNFTFSVILMLITGLSFTWQNSLANTLFQLNSPDELRGRIMSFYTLSMQGMMRLGGLQAGAFSDLFSAPIALGTGAAISLIYGLFVLIKFPIVRKMDH